MLVVSLLGLGNFAQAFQESDQPKVEQPYIQSIAGWGMGSFVPGRWGCLRATVFNPTNEDRLIQINAFVVGREYDQFGRTVKVPARSRVISVFPFLVPERQPSAEEAQQVDPFSTAVNGNAAAPQDPNQPREIKFEQLDIKAWATDVTGPADVPLMARANEPQFEVPANLALPELRMGIIESVYPQPEIFHGMGLEAAVALRTTNRMSTRLHMFIPYEFPSDPAVLDSYDQLVVAGPGLVADSRSTDAFRAWIMRGGRAWIMMDEADLEWVQSVVGDAISFEPADTTTLEQVRWRYVASSSVPDEVRDYEDPVDFHRYLVSGGRTEWTIDGWPATVTLEMGRGRILFSFVGPRALVRPAHQADFGIQPPTVEGAPSLAADMYSSRYKLEDFLEKTSFTSMLGDRPPQFPKEEAANEYVRAHVGYKVPARGMIVGVLFAFCGAIALTGFVLARRERLRVMLYATPAISLVTAIVLTVVGLSSRGNVSEVVAELQVVRGEDGLDEVEIYSAGKVFVNSATPRMVEADSAGTARFLRASSDIKLWQQLWEDTDRWSLPNVSAPVGTTDVIRQQSITLPQTVTVQATFDSQGLIGKLDWPGLSNPADALVRGETRSLLAEVGDDGTFRVSADSELAPGQFVTGATLNDEQQRRQSFLRDYLITDRESAPRNMFYVWGDLQEPGLSYERIERRSGYALHVAPLRLVPPADNTPVRIPQGLLRVRTVQSVATRVREGSTAYSWASGDWVKLAAPAENTSTHFVTFQMPECLLPMKLDEVDCRLEIAANQLRVRLLAVDGEQQIELANEVSPQAAIQLHLTEENMLRLTELGEWVLVLQVERLPETEMGATWQVKSLEVDVRGTARVSP